MAWSLVVEKAIQAGIRDADKLTDIVFYLHHPKWGGRPVAAAETGLINQWKGLQKSYRAAAGDGIGPGLDLGIQ